VVQAAGPVDGDVGQAVVQLDRALDARARVALAEVEEALEHGAVGAHAAHAKLQQLLAQVLGVVRRHALQEADVVVVVELGQLDRRGLARRLPPAPPPAQVKATALALPVLPAPACSGCRPGSAV
jgi:hypothetical protein